MIARRRYTFVIAIAVRRLHDHEIGRVSGRFGIANDREPRSSDVGREDEPRRLASFGRLYDHGRRAKNVACVRVTNANAWSDVEPLVQWAGLHLFFDACAVL